MLSGSADELEAGINGSGDIRAAELETDKTSIRISGSGSADIQAKKELTANINGSGDVRYRGSPTVERI